MKKRIRTCAGSDPFFCFRYGLFVKGILLFTEKNGNDGEYHDDGNDHDDDHRAVITRGGRAAGGDGKDGRKQ